MGESESRRRAASERILEDESLTSDLLDPAARVLLDWGQAQVEALVAQGTPSREFDARLADLRRTLKRIARQAGEEATPEAQVERVRDLLAATAEAVTTSKRRGRGCAKQ